MLKILIVDDDPVVRKLLAKAVSPLDVVSHFASDGIHALDALRCNHDFDLLDIGAEKFIPKPFNNQTLREDIMSTLGYFPAILRLLTA